MRWKLQLQPKLLHRRPARPKVVLLLVGVAVGTTKLKRNNAPIKIAARIIVTIAIVLRKTGEVTTISNPSAIACFPAELLVRLHFQELFD